MKYTESNGTALSRGLLAVAIGIQLLPSPSKAAPIPSQFEPIAVYANLNGAFGLTYDSTRDLIWGSSTIQNGGDGFIHSFKPYKNFSAAERASFFDPILGIQVITPTDADLDVGGLTEVIGGALGYDPVLDLLVSHDPVDGKLKAVTPGANTITVEDYQPGNGVGTGLVDGIDIEGGNTWVSHDVNDIYVNGLLFADNGEPAQASLPDWNGDGSENTLGWSGVEQVGSSVFAVAVQDHGNSGLTRTIVEFDLAGNLVAYDPDGDVRATRWEDLACDGSFLYAADVRGDIDSNGTLGDVYVLGGSACHPLTAVPTPSSLLLLSIGIPALRLLGNTRRRKESPRRSSACPHQSRKYGAAARR